MMGKRRIITLLSTAVVVVALQTSCAERQDRAPKLIGSHRGLNPALLKDDIYKVICFYPPNMWQSFDAQGDRNPEGFAFVLYLVSAATDKGAYALGNLRVRLFRIDRDDQGRRVRTLAQEWTVQTSDLAVRTENKLGYGYQPSLYWGDADAYGKEVEINVQFESPDGTVIAAQTKRARVPAKKTDL